MKFKMNGIEYTIKEFSQKKYKEYRRNEDALTECNETDSTVGIYFGASHQYKNIVFLDEELPLDRKRRVLIHELTHCYIAEYITHEDKNYSEENVADIAANSHDIVHKIVEEYFLDKDTKK